MTECLLRPYQDQDEGEILKLFTAVFGVSRSLAHWQWKFKHNPYAGILASLAWTNDGKLVGQYTVIPVPLNVAGTRHLACQSVDTMVHPQQQGRGLFAATAKACYDLCTANAVTMVIGFPNRNSYPGFMRTFDWVRVAYLDEFQLRLTVINGLRQRLRLPLAAVACAWLYQVWVRAKLSFWLLPLRRRGCGPLHMSDSVPTGADELWQRVKNYEVLSLWKDATYLRWRYDQNPEQTFTYFYLQHEGAIQALAVVTSKGDVAHITELLARDHDVGTSRLLILEIAAHYRQRGIHRLSFIGTDSGYFSSVFTHFEATKRFDLVFCLHVFAGERLAQRAPLQANWRITRGDLDDL